MDAKNSLHQPNAHSAAAAAAVDLNGLNQPFLMVARPAAWATPPNPPSHHFHNTNINHSYHLPSASSSLPLSSIPAPAPAHAPPQPPASSMVSPTHDESHILHQQYQQQQPQQQQQHQQHHPHHEEPHTTEPPRQDSGKGTGNKVRKPRKQNNASAGRSTLFWVHTDPQSVSEGTREETLKRIRSHVMSEHNRKKRLENTKRYKGKAWKHLAFQPLETTASSSSAAPGAATSSVSPAQERHPKASRPPRSRPSSSSSSSGSSSPEQAPREEQQRVVVTNVDDYPPVSAAFVDSHSLEVVSQTQVLSPVQNSSPWTYIGQGTKDPFNAMHTPLSDRMHRHLQHFFDLTRQAYPLQRRYGAKLKAHWATLVQQDPASLHACICVAATNSALTSGEFPLTDPNKQRSSLLLLDTFHHRGETIRLVNEGLSDPIKAASDELIAAVSILLTIEIASGNPDFLKIHLAGLRQMVAMRNSFADVPDDVRYQISWTDIRVACMSLTRPIFPFVRHSRPKHFTITPPSPDLEATASRLMALSGIPGIFGDAMSKLIYDLTDLLWYAEWIKASTKYQEFDDETERYYNTEVLYVEYALHSDRYMATGEAKGDATIDGCVRLACLLFHNSAIWNFYPQIAPVFPKPIIALQIALESTIHAGCYHLCRDLLIWLLFVGASSSNITYHRSFFVNELATAVRLQGIQSWQQLRSLLFGFFYTDQCYLGSLRALWDEIQTMPAAQQCINNL